MILLYYLSIKKPLQISGHQPVFIKIMCTFVGMVKKRRAIPNFFTIGNLIGGILAIIFSLTGALHLAPYCIFLAIVFDFLDGFMAKMVRGQAEIGKQLDSLADMVTFGVAPGIIVYALLIKVHEKLINEGSDYSWLPYLKYMAFLIPVLALFRLAKFNLDTRQTDSFIGVPTATVAIFFAAFPLIIDQTINSSNGLAIWMVENIIQNPFVLIILILVLSALMISEVPLFALKFKHFKWKENEVRFLFLGLSLISILLFMVWSVPIIVLLFILLSLINNAFINGRKQT